MMVDEHAADNRNCTTGLRVEHTLAASRIKTL